MPAALMFCPFHVYGSWLVQMAVLVVLVAAVLTVTVTVVVVAHCPGSGVNV